MLTQQQKIRSRQIFKQELKEKYPFLTEYFEGGIKHETRNPNRSISHSILLYGNDIKAQYALAIDIARLLNCKESQSGTCHCINCNWVRESQHPAVLTISKINSKPSDDESKTVISVKQSQMVKNSLLNTSDYHRVFIFCDAELNGGVWEPLGLNATNFHDETANSLLKIIEEPPANTTFFFLTRDKNDLIQTIISRSQSFFVPSYEVNDKNFALISDIFSEYPNIERKNSFSMADQIFALTKEHGATKILDEIQGFLLELLKSNFNNNDLRAKVLRDVKVVETAKSQIKVRVTPQLAVEDMCLNLTL